MLTEQQKTACVTIQRYWREKVEWLDSETEDEEEICNTCKKYLNHDEDDKRCGVGCKEYDDGWKETHDEEKDIVFCCKNCDEEEED